MIICWKLRCRGRFLTSRTSSPIQWRRRFTTHHSTAAGGFSKAGATVSNGALHAGGDRAGSAACDWCATKFYWNSGSVAFDEVRYELVPDENAEFTRFRAGDLDVTNNVPEQRFEELVGSRIPACSIERRLATFYFSFNTDQGPLSKQPALREALSLAIDREAITASITRAGQVPAYSLVPEGVWNYTPATYEWRKSARMLQRLAKARSLYAAAGYSAGETAAPADAVQRE